MFFTPKLRKTSTQIEIGLSLEVGVYTYTQNMKEVGGATQKHPASHKSMLMIQLCQISDKKNIVYV